MPKSFRRVVTAHDQNGLSVIARDETLTPRRIPSGAADFQLVWATPTVPADNNDSRDGAAIDAGLTLKGGSVIRIVDMLPASSSPMHRSFSIDYGIILSGELELELDGGEVVSLQAGDIVVQRGTNHLWRNPSSDSVCRIAFVLIEAAPVRINGRQLDEVHP
jgi:quercetin dioxygenase-like cupin family protein